MLIFPAAAIAASIPSPSNAVFRLGPLSIHAYGICIALGVLAAVWLSTRLWERQGGSGDDVNTIALWGVPAGIIGARIYHVITDNELYRDQPLKAFAIWDGGLGIWGGVAGGVIVGLLVARRKGLDLRRLMDVTAPALLLAQAIGRVGNYFNQELFGRPTNLPWGLEIDAQNRPLEYMNDTTFHPTFAYEALWNLLLCVALLWLLKRDVLKPGRIFVLYVAGYTFMRFFIERLRVDFANTILGLRINEWTSLICFFFCVGIFIGDLRRRRG